MPGGVGRGNLQKDAGIRPERASAVLRSLEGPSFRLRGPGTGDTLGYILSAFAGILLVVMATWLIGKGLARRDRRHNESQ